MSTRYSSNAGFTLIELMLVIAVLGILALVAISKTPSSGPVYLNAASKQIQSDIELARENAMMTGQTSGVSFSSGGSYTVYQGTTATPLTSPLTKQNMIITLSTDYPNTSISTNYVVEFNSMGAPSTGGGGNVTIINGSTNRIISITSNTGRVTIQ